ncbi:MAG: hypothetical protein COB46_06900 [Rhodospirillaceae bacterium]|nr:MAG: hypothetical protein COB46_06900 [Rhodospirillaceae bacterium]
MLLVANVFVILAWANVFLHLNTLFQIRTFLTLFVLLGVLVSVIFFIIGFLQTAGATIEFQATFPQIDSPMPTIEGPEAAILSVLVIFPLFYGVEIYNKKDSAFQVAKATLPAYFKQCRNLEKTFSLDRNGATGIYLSEVSEKKWTDLKDKSYDRLGIFPHAIHLLNTYDIDFVEFDKQPHIQDYFRMDKGNKQA